jgi:hypothetical protein
MTTVTTNGSSALAAVSYPVSQRPAVTAAFVLGWLLTELFDRDQLPPPDPVEPPQADDRLPAISDMTSYQSSMVLLRQAEAALAVLNEQPGIALPGLDGIGQAMNQPGHDTDDVRQAIRSAYLAIRNLLPGLAPLAGLGFDLGRLLADTISQPTATLAERFADQHVAQACTWLGDLATAFPDRSAAVVGASVHAWATWAAAPPAGGPARADTDGALRRQGQTWFRLLSGEQDATQLLKPSDYIAAGEQLLQHGWQLARKFLWHWSPAIVLFMAGTGAAIWAALTYAPAGASRVVTVLVSAGAAIGLSWRGVGATLGKALDRAEAELWASEVNAAAQRAATYVPAATPWLRSTGFRLRHPLGGSAARAAQNPPHDPLTRAGLSH